MKVKAFIAFALLLIIVSVILRIALAITSGLLHLLWIAGVVMLAIWGWRKAKEKFGNPPTR